MIVEQFLKDIQILIDRGTINPSADINVLGEVYDPEDNNIFDIDTDELVIGTHESSYNKLVLFIK